MIFTASALCSLFGSQLIFDFGAEYYAQAFANAPIKRVFEHPEPASFPLLIPVFILLQAGFILGPLFSWLRLHLFVGEDQIVIKKISSAFLLMGFGLSFIMISNVVYAEFYSQNDAEWRAFIGMTRIVTFFYMTLISTANIIFGVMLYRTKIVPAILPAVTLLFNLLALFLTFLMLNPELPSVISSASVSISSGDILLWSIMLWYWSRSTPLPDQETKTQGSRT